MTQEQFDEVRRLNAEGYSIPDIADELGLEIEDVDEALTEITEDDEGDGTDVGGIVDQDVETMIEILQRMQQEKQNLAAERERIAAERDELDQKMAQLPGHEEQFETFRQRAHKDKLVARSNFLMNEVLENSDKATWSGIEVDDYLERLSALKEKVRKFCDANRLDERRLLVFKGLTFVIDLVGKMQRQQTSGLFSGKSVVFHFKPETRATIEGFVTANFEDETQQVVRVVADQAPAGDDEVWDEN